MRLPAPLSRFLPAFVLALLFAANVAQAAACHFQSTFQSAFHAGDTGPVIGQ